MKGQSQSVSTSQALRPLGATPLSVLESGCVQPIEASLNPDQSENMRGLELTGADLRSARPSELLEQTGFFPQPLLPIFPASQTQALYLKPLNSSLNIRSRTP